MVDCVAGIGKRFGMNPIELQGLQEDQLNVCRAFSGAKKNETRVLSHKLLSCRFS